jgi:raffinose/stachyose/melibiose transport system substrate-binding protein
MSKKILGLVLALAMVFSTLSQVSAEGVSESSEEIIVVDIFQNKSEVASQLEAAARRYMELYPDVQINIETVQGNEYNSALKAKMVQVDAIDILALSANDIANNYADTLADLTDEDWVTHVSPDLLSDATLGGRVVGLPVNIEGYGIAYNTAIFEAAGIDAREIRSFEEIERAFVELQRAIDAGELADQFPLLEAVFSYAAKESWVIGLHTLNIALANEFSSATQTLAADEIQIIHADPLRALFGLLTSFTAVGDETEQLLAVDYSTQVGGGLAIERVAAIQQGNWIGPEVRGIAPEVYENLDFLPLPLSGVNENSIAVGVPAYWAVNSQTSPAEQEAAKAFMQWLYQSDEGKRIVVNELGYIPAFNNYEDITISDPLSAAIMRYVGEGRIMPWVFGGFPSGYEGRAASIIQAYLAGQNGWDETIESLQSAWVELKQ